MSAASHRAKIRDHAGNVLLHSDLKQRLPRKIDSKPPMSALSRSVGDRRGPADRESPL